MLLLDGIYSWTRGRWSKFGRSRRNDVSISQRGVPFCI